MSETSINPRMPTGPYDVPLSEPDLEVHPAVEDLVPPQRDSVTIAIAAQLVVHRGPNSGSGHSLTNDTTTIGRKRDSDIVLDDVTISRCHAVITWRDNRYFIQDCGSLNGTYVNRRPIDRVALSHGDEIWIGTARFTFQAVG